MMQPPFLLSSAARASQGNRLGRLWIAAAILDDIKKR